MRPRPRILSGTGVGEGVSTDMARIIAVTSQKGGVGKTTTAINLSAYLALAGAQVLLVDLDPQSNATSGIGLEGPERSLLPDILEGRMQWSRACQQTPISGLRCLPSSLHLQVPIQESQARGAGVPRLRESWQEAEGDLDYVILDCPPSLGPMTDLALGLADAVLIPVQCEYFAMEGLAQVLARVRQAEQELDRSIDLQGLVLTLYSPEVDLCLDVAREVQRYFPQETLETPILRDSTLAEATSHGKPISLYDPRSPGAWSYMNLAKEILKHESKTRTRA